MSGVSGVLYFEFGANSKSKIQIQIQIKIFFAVSFHSSPEVKIQECCQAAVSILSFAFNTILLSSRLEATKAQNSYISKSIMGGIGRFTRKKKSADATAATNEEQKQLPTAMTVSASVSVPIEASTESSAAGSAGASTVTSTAKSSIRPSDENSNMFASFGVGPTTPGKASTGNFDMDLTMNMEYQYFDGDGGHDEVSGFDSILMPMPIPVDFDTTMTAIGASGTGNEMGHDDNESAPPSTEHESGNIIDKGGGSGADGRKDRATTQNLSSQETNPKAAPACAGGSIISRFRKKTASSQELPAASTSTSALATCEVMNGEGRVLDGSDKNAAVLAVEGTMATLTADEICHAENERINDMGSRSPKVETKDDNDNTQTEGKVQEAGPEPKKDQSNHDPQATMQPMATSENAKPCTENSHHHQASASLSRKRKDTPTELDSAAITVGFLQRIPTSTITPDDNTTATDSKTTVHPKITINAGVTEEPKSTNATLDIESRPRIDKDTGDKELNSTEIVVPVSRGDAEHETSVVCNDNGNVPTQSNAIIKSVMKTSTDIAPSRMSKKCCALLAPASPPKNEKAISNGIADPLTKTKIIPTSLGSAITQDLLHTRAPNNKIFQNDPSAMPVSAHPNHNVHGIDSVLPMDQDPGQPNAPVASHEMQTAARRSITPNTATGKGKLQAARALPADTSSKFVPVNRPEKTERFNLQENSNGNISYSCLKAATGPPSCDIPTSTNSFRGNSTSKSKKFANQAGSKRIDGSPSHKNQHPSQKRASQENSLLPVVVQHANSISKKKKFLTKETTLAGNLTNQLIRGHDQNGNRPTRLPSNKTSHMNRSPTLSVTAPCALAYEAVMNPVTPSPPPRQMNIRQKNFCHTQKHLQKPQRKSHSSKQVDERIVQRPTTHQTISDQPTFEKYDTDKENPSVRVNRINDGKVPANHDKTFDDLVAEFEEDLVESGDIWDRCDANLVELRVKLCISENVSLRLHADYDDLLEEVENTLDSL